MNPLSSLDAQFNPRLAVADAESILAVRRRESLAIAEKMKVQRYTYGDGPREIFFVAGAPTRFSGSKPAVIFIHGGYWRSGAAEDNLLLAPAIEHLGARSIFLGYPLCPDNSLSSVVDAARRGVETILIRSEALGIDARRVVLAGTSAGAHLVARLLAEKRIASQLCGAMLLTGIYDLTPVPLLEVNREIGIDHVDVREQSPLFRHYPAIPSIFAIGGLEPPMWRAQTFAMAALARAAGGATNLIDVPGRHHFDLMMEIVSPDSVLRNALAELIEKMPRSIRSVVSQWPA
jgi:arylformamidase